MGGGGGRPGVRPQPPMPAVPVGAVAQKGGVQGEGKVQVKPRPMPKPKGKETETEPIELVDLNEEDDY